tara:strand:+ start:83 stop:355 length:273 start_codon:yes stop_codon:yes gene_type:complete
MIKHHFHELIENENIDDFIFKKTLEKGINWLIKTEELNEINFILNREIDISMNGNSGILIEYKIEKEESIIGFLTGFKSNDNTYLVVFSH